MKHKQRKPDTPRIWVRIDKAHIAKVIKAREKAEKLHGFHENHGRG